MKSQTEVLNLYDLTEQLCLKTSYQLIFLSMVSGCSEVLCRKSLPLLIHCCPLNCLTIVLKLWCASTVIFFISTGKIYSLL